MIRVFEPRVTFSDTYSVIKTLINNNISGTSPTVERFEKSLANKFERQHVIAVSNGSTALDLAFESLNLKKGDEVLLRWRDQGGTFDAAKITVVDIFETNVPTVDMGQVWIPIRKMWKMTGLENHTTFYVANENFQPSNISGWKYQSQETLLSDLNEIIAMKKISGSIMYLLLLAIALLAIFDTQVLSVFRRQKEIGTYISLGMTRAQVVGLFTKYSTDRANSFEEQISKTEE